MIPQSDPDSQKKSDFDWWTKYYYAVDDERRTQKEYVDAGYDSMMVCIHTLSSSLPSLTPLPPLLSSSPPFPPPMQIYHTELEEHFNRFTDLAQTFALFRGKGSRDPEDAKGEPVGYFKVSCWNCLQLLPPSLPPSLPSFLPFSPLSLPSLPFSPISPQGTVKMYPLPDDGSPEPERMLAHIPSTDPVSVIVRVYVIRVRKHSLAGRQGGREAGREGGREGWREKVHNHIPCPVLLIEVAGLRCSHLSLYRELIFSHKIQMER